MRRSLSRRCRSHRFLRFNSTLYSICRLHRASQVQWWCRLRCNRAPYRRCSYPRRFSSRLLLCSLRRKSVRHSVWALTRRKLERRSVWAFTRRKPERRSVWALTRRKPERRSAWALTHRKPERRSVWELTRRKSERRSVWVLIPFKSERSSKELNSRKPQRRSSRSWERRLLPTLNSRRQSWRSLERSPPTQSRKIPTRSSSLRVARVFASRPATRSEDLLPTSNFICACARARCTTGGTF